MSSTPVRGYATVSDDECSRYRSSLIRAHFLVLGHSPFPFPDYIQWSLSSYAERVQAMSRRELTFLCREPGFESSANTSTILRMFPLQAGLFSPVPHRRTNHAVLSSLTAHATPATALLTHLLVGTTYQISDYRPPRRSPPKIPKYAFSPSRNSGFAVTDSLQSYLLLPSTRPFLTHTFRCLPVTLPQTHRVLQNDCLLNCLIPVILHIIVKLNQFVMRVISSGSSTCRCHVLLPSRLTMPVPASPPLHYPVTSTLSTVISHSAFTSFSFAT